MNAITMVVVGYDGSSDSAIALRWAAALCVAVEAHLQVIHAVGLLEEAHLTPAPPAEADVRRLASEVGLGPDLVAYSLVDGSPGDVLLRMTAPPHRVDLLVIGSRGAGRKPGLLGSTSLEVAERATVPIAIIPSL
ncbi:MAG TPA: universal stress protein [Acidimicrobiales bacterium]|nr:universal stress protein [Acidimicrobiales bacterium]